MVLACCSERLSRTTTRLAVLSSQLCSAERDPPPRKAPAALAWAVSGAAGAAGAQLSVAPAVIYNQRQLEELDREQFLRDGFICLPGIMTPECRKLWSASLRNCQAIQDYMIFNTDWEGLPWEKYGLPKREGKPITQAQKETWAGTSEATFRGFTGNYGRGLSHNLRELAVPKGVENHGFFPEHFPLAYDKFLLEVTTQHPQMIDLQKKLHGDAGPLRVDHTIMLNRKAGATGRTWHSHNYGPNDTLEHDATEGSGLFLVRTLCFPDGVTPGSHDRASVPEDATDGPARGGLVGMVPGSHAYKDPWPGPRLWKAGPPDTGMRENWMKGKVHPATGLPLDIVYPPLPPGSLLCFVHWMPHGVTYIDEGVRWGILLTYRTMDPSRKILATPQIPFAWVEEQRRQGKLTEQQWQILADTPENGLPIFGSS